MLRDLAEFLRNQLGVLKFSGMRKLGTQTYAPTKEEALGGNLKVSIREFPSRANNSLLAQGASVPFPNPIECFVTIVWLCSW